MEQATEVCVAATPRRWQLASSISLTSSTDQRHPLQVAPKRSITRGNVIQAIVVYAAVVADIFVTAYTDPIQTSEVLTHMLLLG
jgi:hypothetical protein